MYREAPFETFGLGLNLRDKADVIEPGAAVDALNVLFTERGAVKQRPGFEAFTSSALTNRGDSLSPYYTTGGTKQLLVGAGTRLEALNTSGGVVASDTALTEGPYSFARFGSPNSEVAYAGNGTDTLRKWDGSTWTSPTATVDGTPSLAMPKAGSICVKSPDNRLVAAGFETTTGGPNGATSSPSHIYFSEAGDPESWTTDNVIILTPGDGERIQAVVSWREFVFAFKESKFFVFSTTGTDASGGAVFEPRPVDTGTGLASRRAVVATHHGVFFMDRTGVYKTLGDEPVQISDLVGPVFHGGSSDFYTGGELDHDSITNCAMHFHDHDLYVAFPTDSANDRVLVYDTHYDWWSLYDFPAAAMTSFRIGAEEELVFALSSGANDIERHNDTLTNDATVAISSRWRGGWYDHGIPDRKRLRQMKVWGSGKLGVSVSADFAQGIGTTDQVDLASGSATLWNGSTWNGAIWESPDALLPKLTRSALKGTVFSTTFTNDILDQDWSVHRLVQHLAGRRIPTVTKAEAA